jgi:hypothetical protein
MVISAWIYIVLTAMKLGNEVLNALSLQFLSSSLANALEDLLSQVRRSPANTLLRPLVPGEGI